MHIGILQTGHVADSLIPEHGDYDQIFQEFLAGQGLTFSNFPVVDDVFPSDARAADGWLITGSRHGAYEDHGWIPKLESLVRDIQSSGRPMVGICFGHQIIAQALGGRVEKHAGGWIVGPEPYQIEGWGDVTLNAWHQDQIIELPEGATPIGANETCKYPALVYGETILTLQPHPEIRPAYMKGLIEVRGPGVVPQPLLDDASERSDVALDKTLVARKIAEFFKAGQRADV